MVALFELELVETTSGVGVVIGTVPDATTVFDVDDTVTICSPARGTSSYRVAGVDHYLKEIGYGEGLFVEKTVRTYVDDDVAAAAPYLAPVPGPGTQPGGGAALSDILIIDGGVVLGLAQAVSGVPRRGATVTLDVPYRGGVYRYHVVHRDHYLNEVSIDLYRQGRIRIHVDRDRD